MNNRTFNIIRRIALYIAGLFILGNGGFTVGKIGIGRVSSKLSAICAHACHGHGYGTAGSPRIHLFSAAADFDFKARI